MTGRPLVVAALVAAMASVPTAPARAEGAAERRVQALDRDGLRALRDGKAEAAARSFETALRLADQKGLGDSKIKAQTLVYLAIARHTTSPSDGGVRGLLEQALAINPHVPLPSSLASGSFQAIFSQLQGDATSAIAVEIPSGVRAGDPVRVGGRALASLGATQLVLVYRPAGAGSFLQRPMSRSGDSFETTLPPDVTARGPCEFFVEARDASGRVLALRGDQNEPLRVEVSMPPGTEPITAGATDVMGVARASGPPRPRGPTVYSLGVAVGSGAGWVRGRPEVFPEAVVDRGVAASPGFVAIEGARALRGGRYSLGAVLRLELLTGTGPVSDPLAPDRADIPSSGTRGAVAGLVRASRWFDAGRARLAASVLAGVGEIRYPVDLRPYAGFRDTLRVGLGLVGAGGVAALEIGDRWSARAGLDALVGLGPTVEWKAMAGGGYQERRSFLNAVVLDGTIGIARAF